MPRGLRLSILRARCQGGGCSPSPFRGQRCHPAPPFCSTQGRTSSPLLCFVCFQALIYYCEALTQPNLQLQKAACLALRYLKVRGKESAVALGFTLKKGDLIGTNNETEIAVAAAVVFLFCIAALHPVTDTALVGNRSEASLQKQPGSATMTEFTFCLSSFPPSHTDFRRLTSTSQTKKFYSSIES